MTVRTYAVGPLRVGRADVTIRTESEEFATAAQAAFVDLRPPVGASSADRPVVFDVVRRAGPQVSWSIRRDGRPCEMELMDEAVLVHQQWELNRLAIESEPTSIHAAAVAHGTRAALLIGHSHSGKTTLAGWLAARHDLGYLTDEVSSVGGDGRVSPYARPLGVRPDSPLAELVGPPRHGPEERLVPVSELGGRTCPDPVAVAVLVFPIFDPSTALDSRPLDRAEAFERVATLTPGLGRHGRAVFRRLAALVEAADAFELRYDDVRAAAPLVCAALEHP